MNTKKNTGQMLSKAELIKSRKPRWLLLISVMFVSLTVFFLLGAAHYGELEVVVVGDGVFKTNRPSIELSPTSSNVVSEVHVRSGQFVKKGDVLISFDSLLIERRNVLYREKLEWAESRARGAFYMINLISLGDFDKFDPPVFSENEKINKVVSEKVKNDHLAWVNTHDDKVLKGEFLSQVTVNFAEQEKQLDLIHGNYIKLYEVSDKLFKREMNAFHREGSALVERLSALINIYQGVLSKLETVRNIQDNKHALKANRLRYYQYQSEKLATLFDEYLRLIGESNNLIEEIDTINYELSQTELKAPSDGYIVQLMDVDDGVAVQALQPLVQFSPKVNDDEYYVKCMLLPKDISLVKKGDRVRVKLDALPFSRYGDIEGEIIYISEGLIDSGNENKRQTYVAHIQINASNLRGLPESFEYLPGLGAQVDIIVGKRSFLSYLLEPVKKALMESFREV